MELPDREACYRALQSRDPRFDGVLFVGVTSTGIYCRPVCPANTARFVNCRFFPSAAAAHEAGFRPCLRCRPETAPELASWRGVANTVSRALALITEGALDNASVAVFAGRLGLGERQLRRLFKQHLGASPLAVAQSRRVLFARQLLHETRLPITEIALAAGFGSVRRFNETFSRIFGRPPGALRHTYSPTPVEQTAAVTLQLRYRPPYDWQSMLDYLQARAIPGVEIVDNGHYYRSVEMDGAVGSIDISHLPERSSLSAAIRFPRVQSLPGIVARVRRLFDLGADIQTVNEHLSSDSLLAPLVGRHPGLRAPGCWDGFELAVRAVLGQQISVPAARRLAGELVALNGRPVSADHAPHRELSHVFPSADRLAAAEPVGLRMPLARRLAIKAVAEAATADPDLFQPIKTAEEAVNRLRSIRGVGEWTAQYIALRVLRQTDAFPASDIALLRALASVSGDSRTTPAVLLRRAEAWRPWRAYAAQHLWTAGARPASSAQLT